MLSKVCVLLSQDPTTALGISGCQSLKVKETLCWALSHEPHHHVKTEAIRACKFVMRQSDSNTSNYTYIRDYLVILYQSESSSDIVKKEAELALMSMGASFRDIRHLDEEVYESKLSSEATTPQANSSRNDVRGKEYFPSRRSSSAQRAKFSRKRITTLLPDSDSLTATVESSQSQQQRAVAARTNTKAVVNQDQALNPIGLHANFTPEEIEVISSNEIVTQASVNRVLDKVKSLSTRDRILENREVIEVTATHSYIKERQQERELIRQELVEKQKQLRGRRDIVLDTELHIKTGRKKNGLYHKGINCI